MSLGNSIRVPKPNDLNNFTPTFVQQILQIENYLFGFHPINNSGFARVVESNDQQTKVLLS